ncbi:MAG TPA: hypothetical protein VGW75_04590 [Solirubrobacteraceae bacterium]|jgi:hypothetical protein|nr:hypothetical protein [Solirubrobacteraceae bacterium]
MPPKPCTRRTRLAERAGLALVAVPLLAVLGLLVGTSGAQDGRPDMILSDNVKYVRHLPEASDGVGARVVGNRLFVTTTKDLLVYDVSDPPNPKKLGGINANISFENEEVPTNGKLLGVSGQVGGCAPAGAPSPIPPGVTDCLVIYDVSNSEAPKVVSVVPGAGDHTHTCVLDCSYFFGSSGTVVDARDPAKATVLREGTTRVDWQKDLPDLESTHHQNEVRPGILITATQPVFVLSVNAEDGGSITKPKILASYRHEPGPREDPPWYSSLGPGGPVRRFIHGARWPNRGADKFVLLGGETNFQPRCHDRVGKFMVMDTTRPSPQGSWTQTDEIWPQNGNYQDGSGRGQTQILGCSAHWFEEHPTFRNGGLVALAEYEQGTRFLQVTPEGRIRQLGFALPIGGSTSAPHWGPDGRTVYNIDYTRGLDVLRYEGPLVVPDEQGNVERPPEALAPGEQPRAAQSAEAPSTGAPVVCASTAGFSRVSAQGGRISVVRRQQRPFTVELFRHSKGRRVVDRRVARLSSSASTLTLPRAKPGFYFARIRMVLPGTDDVRRVALRRRGGRWSVRPDHYLRTSCGALTAFKLERTVFGGRQRVPLRIAYRLPTGVDRVRLEVLRGGKVVRTIRGATERGSAHRYSVPASIARPGTDVRVRIVVERAGALVRETLTSRRL